MSSLIVSGDTSGAITLSAPAVAGSGVLTLPVTTDTLVGRATTDTLTNKTLGSTVVQASNAAPAFSAYAVAASSLVQNVATKILYDTEEFDTNSNFASSRFTPTVAGYYQVSGGVSYGVAPAVSQLLIYKNGTAYKRLSNTSPSTVSAIYGTGLVYCNGSTDYVELYVLQAAATQNSSILTSIETWFNGSMIRSA